MSDRQNSGNPQNLPSSSSSSSSTGKPPSELKNGSSNAHTNGSYSGQKVHYPNPPEATNPDPATLREQWRFAIKQYSRWYSHAWGTAILAGISFFALGWIIKGSNPLPSFKTDKSTSSSSSPSSTSSSNDSSEPRR